VGLTIHYALSSKTRSPERVNALVEQMRQLAMDLPFDSVDGQVAHFGQDVCQRSLEDLRSDQALFSTVLDASQHVAVPWHRKQQAHVSVQPLEIFSFWTVPGTGSEWASFGLARYPAEIELTYCPQDDDRFIKTVKTRFSTSWQFDWRRWERWLKGNGHHGWESPEDKTFQQRRKIKTHLGGWRYSSFCKTQYASNAKHGGVPNFVKCHLCMIHLLDRIGALPTVKVQTNDEGKYGRSFYTDNPHVAEPVYTWHEGQYDVKALVEEVGEWNEMIAGQFGALNDLLKTNATGMGIESPITDFPDFERLEFKEQQNIGPFLQAMKQLADQERTKQAAKSA